ncbi:hypothetical protein [Streptomyces sp. LN245]|uniref:hypothetical protein n=1 Tax=Streptomyces sp. LN245 TaxID=3112975 RepID=UPI00371F8027
MSTDQLISWAVDHHWPAAVTAGLLLAAVATVCVIVVRRASGTVLAAGIGALVCTAFSGDTSWRFAGHTLHMHAGERAGLFAAGEVTVIVCAIMARANKRATAVGGSAGTPGVPGVLVWCITGVQIIPAFSEAGLLGGTVRTVFGPVMAAMLWHLAMGLEIRVARPEALSTGLPAQIGAELRERLLSRLGLATRGRTAVEISRDRATARAVRLASRRHRGWWARAALKASVARSGAATDGGRQGTTSCKQSPHGAPQGSSRPYPSSRRGYPRPYPTRTRVPRSGSRAPSSARWTPSTPYSEYRPRAPT